MTRHLEMCFASNFLDHQSRYDKVKSSLASEEAKALALGLEVKEIEQVRFHIPNSFSSYTSLIPHYPDSA